MDLSKVVTELKPFKGYMPNAKVFTGQGFFNYIRKAPSCSWDILAYTAGDPEIDLQVKRLLHVTGNPPMHCAEKIRRIPLSHSKLWLQYHSRSLIAAYVGSLNFVNPTLNELMVKLDGPEIEVLKDYFNHYWKQGK